MRLKLNSITKFGLRVSSNPEVLIASLGACFALLPEAYGVKFGECTSLLCSYVYPVARTLCLMNDHRKVISRKAKCIKVLLEPVLNACDTYWLWQMFVAES